MLKHYQLLDLQPGGGRRYHCGKRYCKVRRSTDYALGVFFTEMKEAGLYDDSIFVLYGDHTGLSHSEEIDTGMEKLLGKPYDYEGVDAEGAVYYLFSG